MNKCKICGKESELPHEESILETLNCKWNFCGECYTELEGEIENIINNKSEEKMQEIEINKRIGKYFTKKCKDPVKMSCVHLLDYDKYNKDFIYKRCFFCEDQYSFWYKIDEKLYACDLVDNIMDSDEISKEEYEKIRLNIISEVEKREKDKLDAKFKEMKNEEKI